MKKQLEIQKKLVLSCPLFKSLNSHQIPIRPFLIHVSHGAPSVDAPPSAVPSLHPYINSFIHPSLDFLVVCFVSLFSQLALLVSVTGTGGNS